jgi:hypothetical protein
VTDVYDIEAQPEPIPLPITIPQGRPGLPVTVENMTRVRLAVSAFESSGRRATPSMTVTVEESSDGDSWSTVHVFSLSREQTSGEGTFDATGPYLRASWEASGIWGQPKVNAFPFAGAADSPGGGVSSVAGSPVDSVTPSAVGSLVADSTNGAVYIATGLTSADWLAVGAVAGNIGEATGIVWTGGGMSILAGQRDTEFASEAYLGDAYAQWNGHGNGLRWHGNGTDGEQELRLQTGSTGQHAGILQDKNGNMAVPGKATLGTGPSDPLDVATKGYVDDALSNPAQGRYDGLTASIADGASGSISWAFGAGTELLDLTDPLSPAFVADGTYAISFAVVTGALSAAGFYNVNVDIDHGGSGLFHGLVVPIDPATEACFSATINLSAGDTITITIDNNDGSAARVITMTQAILVKLF